MKKVLSVGNCSFDDASLAEMIRGHFDAEVISAVTAEEALAALRREPFALALVNRELETGGDGIALIRQIKDSQELAGVPVMLLSNFPQAQAEAVEAGAEPGFGKAELDTAAVAERLAKFLR